MYDDQHIVESIPWYLFTIRFTTLSEIWSIKRRIFE